MLKKRLVVVVCVASALFAGQSFAIDQMPTARSGEIVCVGGEGSTESNSILHTNFVFRNLDPISSVEFTKIQVYKANGGLVSTLLPSDFPGSFKAIIAPNDMASTNSTTLLNGLVQNTRMTVKVSFKTPDGKPAIAPLGIAAQIDADQSNVLLSRDTVDCVYSVLD